MLGLLNNFLPVVGSEVVQGYIKLKSISDKQDKISNLQWNKQKLEIKASLKNTLVLGYLDKVALVLDYAWAL